jgi:hypothetical protein
VETSCEFVHYLLRRLKINDLGFIEAHDEIDWFGHSLCAYNSETRDVNNLVSRAQEKSHARGTER